MSQPKNTKRVGFGWIWWVIFPPYAFYCLMRSKLKWYFKTPLVILALLVSFLAYDMAANPTRVEEAMAKEVITKYLVDEQQVETVQSVSRMGEGLSVTKDKQESLVYYRVIAEAQLFQIGLYAKDDEELAVRHVEQLYPIRMGIQEDEGRTKAEVAVWLTKNQEKVGVAKSLISETDDGLEQVVKTDKGEYTLKVGNQSVYQVNDKEGKVLLERENEVTLPKEVKTYLEKNEKKVGKFVRTLGYELDFEKELYYFRTTTGEFVTEMYMDGTINLKKKR